MDTANKENVYLLGLLWADGCVRKNNKGYFATSYESNLQDFNEVKSIFQKFGFGCFQERQRKYKNKSFGQPQGSFSTGKQDFCKWLHERGYGHKSSIAPTAILSSIPPKLRYLFWRGYFDGDGCLYLGNRTELAFWSTINQDWSEMEKLFNSLKLKKHSVYKYQRKNGKHCSSVFRTGISDDILKFCEYIYQGYDGIGFSRKYKKYQQFIPMCVKIKESNKTTSRHTGICFNSRNDKWKATIEKNKINGLKKTIHVGWFENENSAIGHRALAITKLAQ